jgi:predicted HTH transcriptional regulator
MIDFDPFNKPLRKVEFDDLDQLSENNISEGIYVEFKQSLPDPQSVAKVIASFANTHGGYFLIGIAEEETTNIASGKVGINTNEHSDPNETVRNIIRDHLNPSPRTV